MILNRERLADILDILKISQGNKVMDVSNCVKFVVDRENHAVYLSTTDFHAFLMVDFGDVSMSVLDDVPEEFLIQFKQFYSVIKASTTDDVSIVNGDNDKHIVVITNGRYKFHLYAEPSRFPIANFESEQIGEWDSGTLRDIIDKVKIAVSRDVTKLAYQGINYDGNWAACDNRRFSIVMSPNGTANETSMLVPPVICDIMSHCRGMVTIGKGADGNMLIIHNPDSGLVGGIRLIDDKFVSYSSLLDNKKINVRMVMPKQPLVGMLNRLSSFTDKLFKIATFSVKYNTDDGAYLSVSIENNDGGSEVLEATDFDYDGQLDEAVRDHELASFSYQIDNLIAGIAAVESSEEVSLSFQEDGKLWIDEDDFHYLLSRIGA